MNYTNPRTKTVREERRESGLRRLLFAFSRSSKKDQEAAGSRGGRRGARGLCKFGFDLVSQIRATFRVLVALQTGRSNPLAGNIRVTRFA